MMSRPPHDGRMEDLMPLFLTIYRHNQALIEAEHAEQAVLVMKSRYPTKDKKQHAVRVYRATPTDEQNFRAAAAHREADGTLDLNKEEEPDA
jgi:hypothetical protein